MSSVETLSKVSRDNQLCADGKQEGTDKSNEASVHLESGTC